MAAAEHAVRRLSVSPSPERGVEFERKRHATRCRMSGIRNGTSVYAKLVAAKERGKASSRDEKCVCTLLRDADVAKASHN